MEDKDKMILEALMQSTYLAILDKYFKEFCDKQTCNSNCDNCIFSFCKTEEECKAMFLTEALHQFVDNF